MRRLRFVAAAMVVALSAALPLRGSDGIDWQPTYYVRVGDKAPGLQATDSAGKVWRTKDFLGKKAVVVVFYLGDFFPACNQRLAAYRDLKPALATLGAEVLAVSGDESENHEMYKQAYHINFPLLSDIDGKASQQWGIYASSGGFTVTKGPDGKEMRLKRGATFANWTFVISRDGKVIYKEMNADPVKDPRRVYDLLYKAATPK